MNDENMDYEFANRWENIRKKELDKKIKCIYPECNNKSVYCHVFQQKNILEPIGVNNQIRMFEFQPYYYGGTPNYKLSGISESFGFYGFCNLHDTKIFKPIEQNVTDDTWGKKSSQYLLAYKTVLRTEIAALKAKEVYNSISNEYPNYNINRQLEILNSDLELSAFYQKVIEDGIRNSDYSQIDFFYHVLSYRIEIANASIIYFDDGFYFGPIDNREYYICDFFPFLDKTYIIIGFLSSIRKTWLEKIESLFLSDSVEDNYIAVNNILVRSAFHCMSPSYYDKIKHKTEQFIEEWRKCNICV